MHSCVDSAALPCRRAAPGWKHARLPQPQLISRRHPPPPATPAGLSNTAGALPGVLGVTAAGYMLDKTGSWAQALFIPTAVCQLFGLVIYSIFASSKRQAWE